MTIGIGYDAASGTLLIMGNAVFPARSLTAAASTAMPDHIQINSIADRGEQSIAWADVRRLDSTDPWTPASMADALAYLQAEFAKGPPLRTINPPYPLTGAASFAINHGLTYVPSATVVDPNGVEVDTDVAHAPGLTTLTFASPFTGTLYLG